jgi:hypothetical protein
MICFDYERRKIVEMGKELKTLLEDEIKKEPL